MEMENDLIKPWKQSQLLPKGVSVPKRVPVFVTCTNEEHTTVESQGINYEFQFAIIHCSKIQCFSQKILFEGQSGPFLGANFLGKGPLN